MSNDLNDDLSDLIGGTARPPVNRAPADFKPAMERLFEEPCPKCHGTGNWRPGYPCFGCKGTGKLQFKTSREERSKSKQQSAARKARNRAEEIEAFKTEHPDVWAWMDGSDFPFAMDLRTKLEQWGSLTENQLAACRRSIEKLAAARAAAKERVESAKTIDMSKIEAAFAKAGAVLKFPKLRVAGFTIYPAGATSKNAGSLYVRGLADDKSEDIYLGRITAGKFIRSRDCSAEREAKLLEVAADPLKATVAYGRLTGSCGCCGRTLTDPESVARGIGPICAEHFGW